MRLTTTIRAGENCSQSNDGGLITGPSDSLSLSEEVPKTGLLARDKIVAVDGHSVTKMTRSEWKEILAISQTTQTGNETVQVTVIREGQKINLPIQKALIGNLESQIEFYRYSSFVCTDSTTHESKRIDVYREDEDTVFSRFQGGEWLKTTKTFDKSFVVNLSHGRAVISEEYLPLSDGARWIVEGGFFVPFSANPFAAPLLSGVYFATGLEVQFGRTKFATVGQLGASPIAFTVLHPTLHAAAKASLEFRVSERLFLDLLPNMARFLVLLTARILKKPLALKIRANIFSLLLAVGLAFHPPVHMGVLLLE